MCKELNFIRPGYPGEALAVAKHNLTRAFLVHIRVLQQAADAEAEPECVMDIEKLLRSRLEAAMKLRHSLQLPSEDTNVYRLCNRCLSTLQSQDISLGPS